MTECNRIFSISHVSGKKISLDFSGGDLSSDGGVLLLKEVENQYKYLSHFSSQISDPREQSKISHSQTQLLTQRVFQICAGYEDVNDSNELRHDSIFQIACNILPKAKKVLASQPTLTRLENRVSDSDIKRLRQFFINEYISSFSSHPERIVLDIDGFADKTHGSQQLSLFHGFYKHKIYHPFFITDAPSGFPVVLQLRAGNVHSGKQVKGLLRWLFWRLKQAFPKTQIVLRGDGGFSLPEVIKVCERSSVEFCFGFSRNPVLERKNQYLMDCARVKFYCTGQKARLFDDVYYMAGSWKEPRRIIMKAECMPEGQNQRFVVTNMTQEAQKVYDDFYVQRAEDSENRIKELKLDIKADRLSCHQFRANQFRLYLHQLAYLFMHTLRNFLAGTEFEKSRITTIRSKLIKLAVRVKESCRRVLCQFSSSTPYRGIFTLVAQKICLIE